MRRLRLLQSIAHAAGLAAATALAAPAASAGAPASATAADAPPSAMIVFDGSGSMWGPLGPEKRSKLDLVREALKSGLAKAAPASRIGLMTFGPRCIDAPVLVPVDAGAADRFTAPLDKLNPRNRGPLALSLREAYKALAPAQGPASIIVIHDDPDNCLPDACAAVSELAKSNPRVAVHLVALGLKPGDVQKVACIAKITGGRLFEANTTATAAGAIAEAMKLARLETAPPEPPAEAEAAPPAPPLPSDSEGPPRIALSASLAPGKGAISQPLRWRITREDDPAATLVDRVAAEIAEPLPAGKYMVEAHYGLVLTRGPIEVAPQGLTAVRVPLNAGTVRITARAARTGEPLSDALATVRRQSEAAEPAGVAVEPIWIGRAESEIVVPAGTYAVALDSDLASVEQTIVLEAGGRASAEFTPAIGRLELSAAMTDGGPAIPDASFVISEDDPDAPQGRREVTRSAHPEPRLTLPAGTYHVTASAGKAEVRQRIAVGPGDTVKRQLVIGVGRLEIAAATETGPLAADAPVVHRVLSLDNQLAEVSRASGANAAFTLPPGRYRILSELGAENVRTSTDVEIGPGNDGRIAPRLLAARLVISPGESVSGPGNTAWEVRDADGRIVCRSGRAEAKTAYLSPGRYTARRDAPNQPLVEKAIELKAGEQRSLDFAVP